MPLNVNSCLCGSTLSIDSVIDASPPPNSSTHSGGFLTVCTSVKNSEIKPRASSLHPKLKMSAEDYKKYKQLMDSLELCKEVHFCDSISSNNKNISTREASFQTSPGSFPVCNSDDENTDNSQLRV